MNTDKIAMGAAGSALGAKRIAPSAIPATIAAAILAAALAACQSGEEEEVVGAFDAIAEEEVLILLGNEPFWNIRVEGDQLNYTTPENPDGTSARINRFAGNGGLGIAGQLAGEELNIAVTPGECSDTMSDVQYPFTVTFALGDALLTGCGYSDSNPVTGQER